MLIKELTKLHEDLNGNVVADEIKDRINTLIDQPVSVFFKEDRLTVAELLSKIKAQIRGKKILSVKAQSFEGAASYRNMETRIERILKLMEVPD